MQQEECGGAQSLGVPPADADDPQHILKVGDFFSSQTWVRGITKNISTDEQPLFLSVGGGTISTRACNCAITVQSVECADALFSNVPGAELC